LCASATTVSVSAVGLSLGRPVSSPPDILAKPQISHSASDIANNAMPSIAFKTSESSPLQNIIPLSPSRSDDEQIHRSRWTRAGSLDQGSNTIISSSHANGNESETSQLDTEQRTPLRTRASWIKRLSTMSSANSSRESSPHPDTPSISNGSMAFSHDGSTAPMLRRHSPSPSPRLPPNKLVKRSASMRNPAMPLKPSVSSSRMPTIRRPATSHQRSATMQQFPSAQDDEHEQVSKMNSTEQSMDGDNSSAKYAQFFSVKVSKTKVGSKRRASNADGKAIRRILPDGRQRPVLVPPHLAPASTIKLDYSSDTESISAGSGPETPLFSQTMPGGDLSDLKHGLPSEDLSESRHTLDSKPRRSFSIGDLITGQQSWKQRNSRSVPSKLQKSSRRISSAPSVNIVHQSQDHDLLKLRRNASWKLAENDTFQSVTTTSHWAPKSPPPHMSRRIPKRNMVSRIGPLDLDNSGSLIDSSTDPETHSSRSHRTPQTFQTPRHSMTASEPASTLVGSDADARAITSGDEEDFDVTSDTVFDSIRTRATRSTSVSRGPRIETIFDESPPPPEKVRGVLGSSFIKDSDGGKNASILEEDERTSSPARTVVPGNLPDGSARNGALQGNSLYSVIPSATRDNPKPLSLGTLEWDALTEENDDGWSFSGDEDENSAVRKVLPSRPVTTYNSGSDIQPPSTANKRPGHLRHRSRIADHADRDTRSSIFDWSEQAPTEKTSHNGEPPRPRTVHGKKDADTRGSRSMGRRGPSGLHARSQSVPVVPDANGKREVVVTNKFGTWGVGSKGVTEDWDDDFDFSSVDNHALRNTEGPRADSGFSMVVPKTIQEQQTKVLANIGLLREWGILIEELKELRVRAANLAILDGSYSDIWQEVDAMIDLADQEVDDPLLPAEFQASSPDVDFDAFEDSAPKDALPSQHIIHSGARVADSTAPSPKIISPSNKPQRKSILAANKGLFEPKDSPSPTRTLAHSNVSHSTPTTRPRKDSEAVARSVIEALQNRKSVSETIPSVEPLAQPRKVPFDTRTLRHIVPYVNGLMHKVKAALRETEGFSTTQSSPEYHASHPYLSGLFVQPEASPSA
jgi:hypothetical protein